jgi:hypothetical protein
VERWIPVYSLGQDRRKAASYCIPPTKALELETDGCAKFNDKRTVLIMQRLEAEMWKPSLSLTPGKAINDFVDGIPEAVAVINSYAFGWSMCAG